VSDFKRRRHTQHNAEIWPCHSHLCHVLFSLPTTTYTMDKSGQTNPFFFTSRRRTVDMNCWWTIRVSQSNQRGEREIFQKTWNNNNITAYYLVDWLSGWLPGFLALWYKSYYIYKRVVV
jgi:hypothetical protein